MNPEAIIARLANGPNAIRAAAMLVSEEDRSWKPSARDWSVLEIVCHLADEEDEDFPRRLRLLLGDPEQEWPPIDPERWAIERDYPSQDLTQQLDHFAKRRAGHVAWLRSLGASDWSVKKTHPVFGSMHAGELLGAWAAHDALHLRQITKRIYQLTQRDAAPYGTQYAGEW